jgi:hypothetical protein
MQKGIICFALCVLLFASVLFADSDSRERKLPPPTPNPYIFRPSNPTMFFSPMEIDTTPDYPPFHDYPIYRAGVTYYDMQHNITKGRNIAIDPDGGVHVAWMNGLDETFSNRRIFYNYKHPDSSSFECNGSTGIRVDGRAYAGYCNISVDNSSTVPTVAYHDRPSGSTTLGTNVAYDGMYYAMGGESRCAFVNPTEIPAPYAPYGLNVQPIWPKLAQLDTTIFMVSTPSISDTTIGGIYYGQSVIFYRGWIAPEWLGFTEATFAPPVELAHDQNGITCDVAAWTDGTNSKVAVAWVDVDTFTLNDSCFCDDPAQWANLFDPAYIALRVSEDMGETFSPVQAVTQPGVHIYTGYQDSIYLGYELDTMTVPPETIHVYRPVYSRPIDVNVTIDNNGDIHLVWMGALISPKEGWEFDCFGSCSTSVWCRSIIYHWKEGSSRLDTVVIDPIGYCNAFSRVNYVGNSIEPQVAVDEDGDIFVCWEQLYSELLWDLCPSCSVYLDVSEADYENSEIFCSMLPAGTIEWTDPINISNTYTPGCGPGDCWCELDMTLAEKADDKIHLSFVRDTYAGFSELLGTGTTTTLNEVYYVMIPESVFDPANIPEIDLNGVTMPETFRLGRNFPNPFNAATGFWFDVYEPGNFTVDVIDIMGRVVSRVVSSDLEKGRHHFVWNGVSDNGWGVPSGTYFLRAVDAQGAEFTRKITLIK